MCVYAHMHDLVLTAPCRKVCVRARSNATTLLGLPAKSQRKSVCDIWVAWTAAEALLAPPCLTLSARRRTFNATSPGARKSMVKVLQEVGGRAHLPGGPIPAVFAEDSALSRALGELRRATRQKVALIVSDLNEHAMRISDACKLLFRRRHTYLRE